MIQPEIVPETGAKYNPEYWRGKEVEEQAKRVAQLIRKAELWDSIQACIEPTYDDTSSTDCVMCGECKTILNPSRTVEGKLFNPSVEIYKAQG